MRNYIDEYLVRLGADVDVASFYRLYKHLEETEKLTQRAFLAFTKNLRIFNSMAKGVLGFQSFAVGAFAAIGSAAVGLIDKIAMADQSYRLFGLHMFMSRERAQALKITLDSLGVSLAEATWDPELLDRAQRLMVLQAQLMEKLGPDYEKNLRNVREFRFQLTEAQVELKYFGMAAVNAFLTLLGGSVEDGIKKLERWNQWFVKNIPTMANTLATEFLPVWKEIWSVFKDIKEIVSDLAVDFINLSGNIYELFTGKKGAHTDKLDFKSMAEALREDVQLTDDLLKNILGIEKSLSSFSIEHPRVAGSIAAGIGLLSMSSFTAAAIGALKLGRRLFGKGALANAGKAVATAGQAAAEGEAAAEAAAAAGGAAAAGEASAGAGAVAAAGEAAGGGALTAILGFSWPIVVAMAAGAAIAWVISNPGKVHDAIAKAWNTVKEDAPKVGGAIKKGFDGVVGSISDFVKSFEGHVKGFGAYKDAAGRLTTGYGHLVKPGEVVQPGSEAEANRLLQKDLAQALASVHRLVRVHLNENQEKALTDFVYNFGAGALEHSTLLKLLNMGDYERAALEFLRWDKANVNGRMVELPGLAARRRAEMELFLAPVASGNRGQQTQIGQVTFHIYPSPSASPEEIADAVHDRLQSANRQSTQRNLQEFQSMSFGYSGAY